MAYTHVAPMRNVIAFLAGATAGSTLIYASGASLPPVSVAPGVAAIRRAYNNGDIELVQRRRSDGGIDYLAVRRRLRARLEPAFKFPAQMCG